MQFAPSQADVVDTYDCCGLFCQLAEDMLKLLRPNLYTQQ